MTASMLLNCIHPPIVGSAATRFESTGVPPRLHVTRRDFASLSLPVSLSSLLRGPGFGKPDDPVLTVPPRARRTISDKTNSACAADLICGSIHPDRGPGFQGCTTARFADPLHGVIPTCLVLSTLRSRNTKRNRDGEIHTACRFALHSLQVCWNVTLNGDPFMMEQANLK
jgi:hypothetical protein